MAVEEIELRLTVDGRPAQKALDETRTMAQKLGGGLNSVVGSLDGMQKGAQALQQKLAPTAAAISGVASALGQTGGEAGKVVAGIGQMAAAFGAGGPWAVAIVGATMLADQYIAAQKEIDQNARFADEAVQRFGENLRNKSSKGLEWIRDKADEAAKAVREFGKTSQQITVANARLEMEATEQRIKGIDETIQRRQENLKRLRAEINDPAVINSRQDIIDRMQAMVDEQKLMAISTTRRTELTTTLKGQQDETRRLIEQQSRLAVLEGGKGGGGGRAGAPVDTSARALQARLVAHWAAQEAAQAAASAAADAALEDDISRMAAAGQAARDYEKLKTDIAEEGYQQRDALRNAEAAAEKAAIEERNNFLASAASGAAGTIASASQQLLSDIITGQEHATERFAAFIMQQAGQSLISNGVQLFGEATKNALIGNPMAAGQFVGATALVGLGVSLGGAAVGVTHAAAGGKFGQKLPSESTSGRGTDPGARARPAAGGRGGGDGGTNLTIIYGGISGPSADDGARALTKAARRANRRGLA